MFKWTYVEKLFVLEIKKSRNWRPTFLCEEFKIHIDASTTQLGGVMNQNDEPIASYSQKPTPA